MTIKDSPRYKQLQQSLDAIKDLGVPENLQRTALEYLLGETPGSSTPPSPVSPPGTSVAPRNKISLRDFMAELRPKGAVSEIPCLLYWAKMEEGTDSLDERGVVELYRRAGLRPPRNVAQSLRDLCSKKKYGRLETMPGKTGHVKLSRVGEDYVLHDVKQS